MVKTLLELGADPNLPGFVHITPRSDKSGHTETHAASQKTSRNMRSLRRVSSSPSVKGRKQATAGVGESERQTSVVESDGSAQDLAISGPMLLFASCKHLKHREQVCFFGALMRNDGLPNETALQSRRKVRSLCIFRSSTT